jgi:CheY-like chemotaxis protein
MVVDDEPLSRRAITNALQLAFGKPDSAENGEEAVALAQSKVFDVIFLDIMMPEMDGFETCSKIRETKLNGTTPVIFVTSQRDTESREKAFEAGGNGFISKPVLPAEIFLTALTFALRGQMEKHECEVAAEKLEAVLC